MLRYVTGTPCVPAGGFKLLMGINGLEHFTIQHLDRDQATLPVAATCFNRLKLPVYASQAQLEAKLRYVITEAEGFAEGAVAE